VDGKVGDYGFNTKERGGVWQLRFGEYGEEREIIDVRFLEPASFYPHLLTSPAGMSYNHP
jgi:hypothetical protein